MNQPKNNYIAAVIVVLALLGVSYYAATHEIFSQESPTPLSVESISPLDRAIQEQRDKAVQLGRDGHYDEALTALSKLHEQYPEAEGITLHKPFVCPEIHRCRWCTEHRHSLTDQC